MNFHRISNCQSVRATFAMSQRIISTFGSRQGDGTRNSHEMSRKHSVDRGRESLSNEIILVHLWTNRCNHGQKRWRRRRLASCDAATSPVAFSCGFVRFSCPGALPRTEGLFRDRSFGAKVVSTVCQRRVQFRQWRPSSPKRSVAKQATASLGKAPGFCVSRASARFSDSVIR